jgi:hypothetical protein
MGEVSNDDGILAALGKRLVEQRLPRLEFLKERLGQGEVLTDEDITFLKQAFDDAHTNKALIERHAELQATSGRIMHLYKEIMDKALENEKKSQS